MKGRSIPFRIKRLTALLGASVLLIWGFFYLHTARDLRRTNQQHMQQISQQIIARLEAELLGLENLSFTLSRHGAVHDALQETDVLAYYKKTGAVDELLDTLNTSSGFAHNLILSNREGVSSCFGEMLGTSALRQLDAAFAEASLPRYTALSLEGVRYVCYARAVETDSAAIGSLYLLVREDKLLGLFNEYVTGEDFWIALAENGAAVTSGQPERLGLESAMLESEFALTLRRHVGASPFEIWVGVEKSYLADTSSDYGVAVFLTAGLFVGMLVIYLSVANRHFFRPMVAVIREVDTLGTDEPGNRLSRTGDDSFDGLVDQINQMLKRLEERSQTLLETQSALNHTEIERQRALIISLKKQINAHFTVNILNIIKVLSGQGKTDEAAQMADGLSHLLRHANDEDEFCSGMDVLYVLEKYVTIMEIRYPGRFEADFSWDDRLIHAKIPRMLLQPIVENAITHGFSEMAQGGRVEISALLEGEIASFRIQDNGKGISARELEQLQGEIADASIPVWNVGGTERIALANIQRRIWSYYGEGWGLCIESEAGEGTVVCLDMPAWPPDGI